MAKSAVADEMTAKTEGTGVLVVLAVRAEDLGLFGPRDG